MNDVAILPFGAAIMKNGRIGEQTRPVDRSMIVKKIGEIVDDGLFDEILAAADVIVKSYK